MKASYIQNILALFAISVILQGEVQGVSFQEENKKERQGGYIRQRNLSHCPYIVGTPCWGVKVCRGGKTACVTPREVFKNDVCGDCEASQGSDAQENNEGGKANPQGGVIKGNAGNTKPTIYIPNAANCPHRETSPCYGVPVCRTVAGKPVDRCMDARYVLKTDKCGYCDADGTTDTQENDEGGNATPQGGTNPQQNPDDGSLSAGEKETGNGIITGNTGGSNPTVYIPNAANCAHSETSPCFGVPVCRMVDSKPVDRCMDARYVLKTDKCGYCNNES